MEIEKCIIAETSKPCNVSKRCCLNHQIENIIIHPPPPQEIQIKYFKIMIKWYQVHVKFHNCVHTMLAVFQTFQSTK